MECDSVYTYYCSRSPAVDDTHIPGIYDDTTTTRSTAIYTAGIYIYIGELELSVLLLYLVFDYRRRFAPRAVSAGYTLALEEE